MVMILHSLMWQKALLNWQAESAILIEHMLGATAESRYFPFASCALSFLLPSGGGSADSP
jgi:hypothetical protein